MKQEKFINEIKANKKVNYKEAVRQAQEMKRETNDSQWLIAGKPEPIRLASRVNNVERNSGESQDSRQVAGAEANNQRRVETIQERVIRHEMGTQTEVVQDSEAPIDDKTENIPKWAAFMLQILTIRDITDQDEKCKALAKALSVILGVDAPTEEVKRYLTPPVSRVQRTKKINTPKTKWNR